MNEVIRSAIRHYEKKRFTFNEFIRTVTTTSGNQYVDVPTGLLQDDRVQVTIGGHEYGLRKHHYTDIERMHGASDTSGQTSDYTYQNGQFRIWPTPNDAYTLHVSGLYQLDTLNGGADSSAWADSATNAWTTDAQDLINHRCKFTLARDYLMDRELLENARLAEIEAYNNLRYEAGAAQQTGRVRTHL